MARPTRRRPAQHGRPRAGTPSRLVTLHRSSHGVVVQLVRVVLLVVCVAVLGQNLATVHHWSTQSWVVSALLALYVVGAFVELARSFAPTDIVLVDGDLVICAPTLLRQPLWIARHQVTDVAVTPRWLVRLFRPAPLLGP